jgi:hypothetical protein
MLTRTTIARLTPTARRILGGNAWKKHGRLLAAMLLSLAMGAVTLAADISPGVVRLSDHPPQSAPNVSGDPGLSGAAVTPIGNSQTVVIGADCPAEECPEPSHHCCLGHCCLGHCCLGHCCLGCCPCCCCCPCCGCCCSCVGACWQHVFGKDANGKGLLARCCPFQCGNCGWQFLDAHCYCMTYAVNPWYADGRDGRVYAACGYGAPMTVPLAPTVTNQYNYGWGIPSGRLTPISRVAPRPGALTTTVAPY